MVEIVNLLQYSCQHYKEIPHEGDINDQTMAALSNTEKNVYRIQQKVKKQQLTLMDMWKKQITFLTQYIELDYTFIVIP